VIAHLLAWKVIPSVAPQIPVFFLSLFPFLHQAFQVRPFCSICMKWVVLLWLLCCLRAYNFSGWRWTKCHSAYLLPFSLAYIITFNLKPTIYEIAVFSTHSVRWKNVHSFSFCATRKCVLLSNWCKKWWDCLVARMNHCYPPENAGITIVLRSYWQL
jgi:hypothetical protein